MNAELYSLLNDFDKELNNVVQTLLTDLQLNAKSVSPWSFQGIKDFFKRVFNTKREHFNLHDLITLNEIVDKSCHSLINEIQAPNQNMALDKFRNALKALASKFIYKAHELGRLNANATPEVEPTPTAVPLEEPKAVAPQPTTVINPPKQPVKTVVKKTTKTAPKDKKIATKKKVVKKKEPKVKNRLSKPSVFNPINFDNDLIS